MASERPERKLDFHAPLLSARRPGRIIVRREKWEMNSSSGFIDRVPFSWEQSPGKPKETFIRTRKDEEKSNDMALILPLKPPPVRLHPNLNRSKDSSSSEEHDDDDDNGCDGDVDVNNEDGDFFSGGLDLFSLAESSNAMKQVGCGGGKRGPPPPSFIMERFLRAAVALAAASSSYPDMETPGNSDGGHAVRGWDGDAAAGEGRTTKAVGDRGVSLPSVSSPLALKGCGLEISLPWRARPKKYAVRGPLRFGCSGSKPQLSRRPK